MSLTASTRSFRFGSPDGNASQHRPVCSGVHPSAKKSDVQSAGPAPSISAAMPSAISSSPGAYRIVCVNAWPAKPRMRPRARSTMSSDAGSMAASLKFSRIFLFGAQAAG